MRAILGYQEDVLEQEEDLGRLLRLSRTENQPIWGRWQQWH